MDSHSNHEMMTLMYYRSLSAKLYKVYVAIAFMGLLTVTLTMDVL